MVTGGNLRELERLLTHFVSGIISSVYTPASQERDFTIHNIQYSQFAGKLTPLGPFASQPPPACRLPVKKTLATGTTFIPGFPPSMMYYISFIFI